MSLKRTINRRRKEGESTKSAAKRLVSDSDKTDVGYKVASIWLANKKQKVVRRQPKAKPAEAVATNNVKTKRR